MKCLVAITLLLVAKVSVAQNLVPNPALEGSCPPDLAYGVIGWHHWGGSPDYFNVCGVSINCQVPFNAFGFQYPHSGNGMYGFVTYNGDWGGTGYVRERIGVELLQPTVVGQKYFFSFFVCRAFKAYAATGATNRIGFRLSTDTSIWHTEPINNFAHFSVDTIITDSINWTLISGSIIADSSYYNLVIGNFFDDALTSFEDLPPYTNSAYYYVDDVCLTTDSLYNEYWTSNHHQPVQSRLSVYPTISHQGIDFTFPQGSTRFNIFNAIGQSVYTSNVTSLHQTVDLSKFSEGIYFVRAQSHQGIQTAKFVVQRN